MRRAFWALTAALQLSLPGAAAWADARLDAAAARATPHFERHSTATCVLVHPGACALCRFLTTPLDRARAIRIALPAPDQAAPMGAGLVAGPLQRAGRLPLSRAPPALP